MTYHERDTDEELAALSTRFRDHEFTEDVYRASLFAKGIRGPDIEEIVAADLAIRAQFVGANVRLRSPMAADNIATVINSIKGHHP